MAQTERAKRLADAKELLKQAKKSYLAGDTGTFNAQTRQAGAIAQEVAKEFAQGRIEGADDRAALVADTLAATKILKAVHDFGLARRMLEPVLRIVPKDVTIAQQLALCTYKDEELPPDDRFAKALEILEAIGLREPQCSDPETLGQGGAIHKRRWERTGRLEDLHSALHCYRKGWESNPRKDKGYCGINAAYLLDVLAYRFAARGQGAARDLKESFAQQARDLRRDILERTPAFANAAGEDQGYFYLVTMAEAAFGLKDWGAAAMWLAQARGADHDEWERQTTAKQMVSLARMLGHEPPPSRDPKSWNGPWRALAALLGEQSFAAFQSYRGKVGLALSGGGFRASLYHLGVLARLAECDILRSVEVLSTVSGGSILGAHYYLALAKRLRGKPDAELRKEDYLELVREVIAQFLAGVQKNLRVRAFTNLWANMKMLVPFFGYGRSNRMGELYEKHLYGAVDDGVKRRRRMSDLLIHPMTRRADKGRPAEHDEGFKPKFSNWQREAKVPVLLLNTTSLNSGHNWQFTASWMGEPPGLMGQEVDMNERYRRLYYWQAPEKLRDYPLGYAVAASAGVPALFDPLVIKGLYKDRTVRLVDGGVHDNQGVAGLLDEGCTLLLCSDASGQMDDQHSPAASELAVFFRSDSILQDRLRESQYQDLAWRVQTGALNGLFFVHLKEELETDPLDWNGIDPAEETKPTQRPPRTKYGVNREIQAHLSAVRTDLDSFTDVEAYSLMASGYRMAQRQLECLQEAHRKAFPLGTWGDFDIDAPCERDWAFASMLPLVRETPGKDNARAQDLALQLETSQRLFGKVWFLTPWLQALTYIMGGLLLAAAVWWIAKNWERAFAFEVGVKTVVFTLGLGVLGLLLPFVRQVQWFASVRKWLATAVVALLGFVLSNLYLWLFDPLFRSRGKVDRLVELQHAEADEPEADLAQQ